MDEPCSSSSNVVVVASTTGSSSNTLRSFSLSLSLSLSLSGSIQTRNRKRGSSLLTHARTRVCDVTHFVSPQERKKTKKLPFFLHRARMRFSSPSHARTQRYIGGMGPRHDSSSSSNAGSSSNGGGNGDDGDGASVVAAEEKESFFFLSFFLSCLILGVSPVVFQRPCGQQNPKVTTEATSCSVRRVSSGDFDA